MAFWHYALLFGSVLLGGGLAMLRGRQLTEHLPLLLSFSGAYLLAIAALELLPEVFGTGQPASPGLFVLLGFSVQLLLEGFSQGVEHGHVHAHQHAGRAYAIQVMLGLGVHALLEGLPLGTGGAAGGSSLGMGHLHEDHLLYGIVLHKLPAAFALGLLLRHSGYSRPLVWSCLTIFGLLSPLGALIGQVASIDPLWRIRILALVIGSLLHISTTILFEADGGRSHGISVRKFLIILMGMLAAYLTAH